MNKTYELGKCPRCKCEDSKIIQNSGQPMIVCQRCNNWEWLDDADDSWVKVVEVKDGNQKS